MMPLHALISPAYLATQKVLHFDPRGYGGRGHKWAPVVRDLMAEYQAGSVLDYGCGQGSLARALRADTPVWRIAEYDPAIEGKDGPPVFADLVVCTDVLEHIEEDKLPAVLAHLKLLARKAVFVVISTCETAKVLTDGRNAHILIHDGGWWTERLSQAGFRVLPPPASARQKPDKEWVAVLVPA